MKIGYYPGCSLQSSAKEYDRATRLVARHLGIQLHDINDWNCCGATAAHSMDHFLAAALPARNLIIAEEMGLDVTVPCAACYQRLRLAHRVLAENEETARDISQLIGRPYKGKVRIYSLIETIAGIGLEQLAAQVVRPLKELRVACYYGCLLVRPPGTGCDDPENPRLMDELLEAAKAETLDWGYKNECCGASLVFSERRLALHLIRNILRNAVDAGATSIACACPLCQSNLDTRQGQVNKEFGTSFAMPIFYFPQLLGLAMGLNPQDLGLGMHFVDPQRAIKAVSG
ncbi:MAG: heterodisulfide reductase subunit B [Ammonifex sp.]|jgi:heterodisulfide reductase subunit B|nr:MAG: heterodisulfide reductase subunit B [Ammonifex sp.]